MFDDLKNSLLMSLFRVAVILLGIVAALYFAVQLLAQIWPWLVGIGCTLAVFTVALAIWRSRRNRSRW